MFTAVAAHRAIQGNFDYRPAMAIGAEADVLGDRAMTLGREFHRHADHRAENSGMITGTERPTFVPLRNNAQEFGELPYAWSLGCGGPQVGDDRNGEIVMPHPVRFAPAQCLQLLDRVRRVA